MNVVKRLKVVVEPVLGLWDEQGNLLREIPGPKAVLYYPLEEQFAALLTKLEVDAMDQLNEHGQPTRMSGAGKDQVSRGRNGKGEDDEGRGAGLRGRHRLREHTGAGQEPDGEKSGAPGGEEG